MYNLYETFLVTLQKFTITLNKLLTREYTLILEVNIIKLINNQFFAKMEKRQINLSF